MWKQSLKQIQVNEFQLNSFLLELKPSLQTCACFRNVTDSSSEVISPLLIPVVLHSLLFIETNSFPSKMTRYFGRTTCEFLDLVILIFLLWLLCLARMSEISSNCKQTSICLFYFSSTWFWETYMHIHITSHPWDPGTQTHTAYVNSTSYAVIQLSSVNSSVSYCHLSVLHIL